MHAGGHDLTVLLTYFEQDDLVNEWDLLVTRHVRLAGYRASAPSLCVERSKDGGLWLDFGRTFYSHAGFRHNLPEYRRAIPARFRMTTNSLFSSTESGGGDRRDLAFEIREANELSVIPYLVDQPEKIDAAWDALRNKNAALLSGGRFLQMAGVVIFGKLHRVAS